MDDLGGACAEEGAESLRGTEAPPRGGAPHSQSEAITCLQAQMNLLQMQLSQVAEVLQDMRRPNAGGLREPEPSQADHFDVYSDPSGGGEEGRSASEERPRSRSPPGRTSSKRSQRSKAKK